MSTARCRFAPSPTGYLHVGGAQSALFNWLFARGSGGEFLLRIEDTDAERNRPELTDNILDMMHWLGLEWEGEPLRQSERIGLYSDAAAALFTAGHSYYCGCTAEEVQARNKAAGGKPGYDGHCRPLGLGPGPGRALRFRIPDGGVTEWDDLIRGTVRFEHANLEDFVIVRSSGMPMFLLANVYDDHDSAMTHVIRGEDHVNNTPKYILLWDALGYGARPTFAHLPLLVNEARKKLSKRRDDVSVAIYKDRGFLPEAMRNYLALLGWGPPDGVEVRPIEEIVALFRLEDVNPSPAFFDVRKLEHVNGEYIRALAVEEFVARAAPFLPEGEAPVAALRAIAPLVQERIKRLDEVPAYVDFLYLDAPVIDDGDFAKEVAKLPDAVPVVDGLAAALADVAWDGEAIHAAVDGVAAAHGYTNPRKVHAVLRVAVTGRKVGPPLFESLVALGRDGAMSRLAAARERLTA